MDNNITIRFKAIEILSKSLTPPPNVGIIGDNFNFQINAIISVNEQEKLILVVVDIKISEVGKEDIILGSIVVGCGFAIENFSDTLNKNEEGKYNIPAQVDTLVKAMAVSTTRGIMFTEFRGTVLHQAILPIVFLPTPEIEKANDI